eukprot:6197286-Pleurochrysis_carterae.AAC.2
MLRAGLPTCAGVPTHASTDLHVFILLALADLPALTDVHVHFDLYARVPLLVPAVRPCLHPPIDLHSCVDSRPHIHFSSYSGIRPHASLYMSINVLPYADLPSCTHAHLPTRARAHVYPRVGL